MEVNISCIRFCKPGRCIIECTEDESTTAIVEMSRESCQMFRGIFKWWVIFFMLSFHLTVLNASSFDFVLYEIQQFESQPTRSCIRDWRHEVCWAAITIESDQGRSDLPACWTSLPEFQVRHTAAVWPQRSPKGTSDHWVSPHPPTYTPYLWVGEHLISHVATGRLMFAYCSRMSCTVFYSS